MECQLIIEGVGTINMSSEYIGDKQSTWSKSNYNNHLIEVSLSDNDDDVKSLDFEYWASISQPEIQSKEDLLSALKCCISDGLSGLLDFEDFCSEFGYNSDSISDKKVYDSCVESSQKLLDVFGSEDRIEEIDIFLNENFDI